MWIGAEWIREKGYLPRPSLDRFAWNVGTGYYTFPWLNSEVVGKKCLVCGVLSLSLASGTWLSSLLFHTSRSIFVLTLKDPGIKRGAFLPASCLVLLGPAPEQTKYLQQLTIGLASWVSWSRAPAMKYGTLYFSSSYIHEVSNPRDFRGAPFSPVKAMAHKTGEKPFEKVKKIQLN